MPAVANRKQRQRTPAFAETSGGSRPFQASALRAGSRLRFSLGGLRATSKSLQADLIAAFVDLIKLVGVEITEGLKVIPVRSDCAQ
jgi:hypothetical protein